MTAALRTLAAGLLLLSAAGCTGDGTDADQPGSSATAPTATTSAAAAPTANRDTACVTGAWRATGVRSSGDAGTLTGRAAGGAGVTMTVGSDGITRVGFGDAEPVTFSAQAAGAKLAGEIAYTGSLSGAVAFEPSAIAGQGAWNPRGEAVDDGLKVTVKLTEPFSVTLLDRADISAALPDTVDTLDTLPVLRGGSYRCDADALEVRTERDGPTMIWTFTRTGR
jgi:hypothetical protein